MSGQTKPGDHKQEVNIKINSWLSKKTEMVAGGQAYFCEAVIYHFWCLWIIMFWKTVLWIVIAVHSMKRELPKSSILYTYIEDELKKWNRKSGQMFLTSIWWLKKNHFWVFSCNLTLKWVCSDWPTADFPRELIAAQRSPKHVAEIKCADCFLSREKCKIVVCELVSETPPYPP